MHSAAKRVVISGGVVIPAGTVDLVAPRNGRKFEKLYEQVRIASPNWVRWYFYDRSEYENAAKYLLYFFKDRDKLEIRHSKSKCFVLTRLRLKEKGTNG